MRKTTVYLPEDLKASLERVALETERSVAEIIREALRKAVDESVLSALFPDQPRHEDSARILRELPIPGILPSFVLAEVDYMIGELETLDLLTLDERHFRVVRGWRDRPFRILPADS